MAKNLVIPLEKLEEAEGPKQKLVNFWVEREIFESFEKLCEKELKQKSIAKVLRTIIREICEHYGYQK
jgi:Glu-tRNA(Gln) amidotransferase subunit E-like FAD-binding protein